MADSTETRIAVLEKEFDSITGLFDRLDRTIESLTDISHSVKQLLAVHDSRLDTQEKMDEKLSDMIEKRKVTTDQQYEALHKRIGEMKDEIYDEIEKNNEKIENVLTKMANDQQEHHRIMLEKVGTIEKWKWIIIGGAIVIGYLTGHVDFFVRLLG